MGDPSPALEEDFTGENASEDGADVPVVEKQWNKDKARESMRGVVTSLLLGVLGFIILASFAILVWGNKFEQLKELLTLIFTPIVTLVGTSVGFYFGEQSRKP